MAIGNSVGGSVASALWLLLAVPGETKHRVDYQAWWVGTMLQRAVRETTLCAIKQ